MLTGVGIDVASIPRIGALLDRYGSRFVERWFDPTEIDESSSQALAVRLASRFAVKEAVWKALALDPPGPLAWRDIVVDVLPGRCDTVRVRLVGALAVRSSADGIGMISATTAVHGETVVAFALVEAAVDPA